MTSDTTTTTTKQPKPGYPPPPVPIEKIKRAFYVTYDAIGGDLGGEDSNGRPQRSIKRRDLFEVCCDYVHMFAVQNTCGGAVLTKAEWKALLRYIIERKRGSAAERAFIKAVLPYESYEVGNSCRPLRNAIGRFTKPTVK